MLEIALDGVLESLDPLIAHHLCFKLLLAGGGLLALLLQALVDLRLELELALVCLILELAQGCIDLFPLLDSAVLNALLEFFHLIVPLDFQL